MKLVSAVMLTGSVLSFSTLAQVPGAPSADQIVAHYIEAIGGKSAIEKVTSRIMKGTVDNSDDGTTSPAEIYAKAPNKYLAVIDVPNAGASLAGWNGEMGWSKDPDSGVHEMGKPDLPAARRDHEFYRELKLREIFPKMTVSGKTKVDERDAYVVEAAAMDGSIEKLYFDAQSGLLVRRDFERVNIDDGIILYEVDYDDYKDVEGIRTPFTITRKTPDYSLTYRFKEVKYNVPIDDVKFNKPAK